MSCAAARFRRRSMPPGSASFTDSAFRQGLSASCTNSLAAGCDDAALFFLFIFQHLSSTRRSACYFSLCSFESSDILVSDRGKGWSEEKVLPFWQWHQFFLERKVCKQDQSMRFHYLTALACCVWSPETVHEINEQKNCIPTSIQEDDQDMDA